MRSAAVANSNRRHRIPETLILWRGDVSAVVITHQELLKIHSIGSRSLLEFLRNRSAFCQLALKRSRSAKSAGPPRGCFYRMTNALSQNQRSLPFHQERRDPRVRIVELRGSTQSQHRHIHHVQSIGLRARWDERHTGWSFRRTGNACGRHQTSAGCRLPTKKNAANSAVEHRAYKMLATAIQLAIIARLRISGARGGAKGSTLNAYRNAAILFPPKDTLQCQLIVRFKPNSATLGERPSSMCGRNIRP
jgi:hypothetical protein